MKRIRAFTLVEILLVIGIIGLLLAILMPALGQARAQGRLIKCGAHLREMGIALSVYANDNQGILPLNDGEPWTNAYAVEQTVEMMINGAPFSWVRKLQLSMNRAEAPWLQPLRCPEVFFETSPDADARQRPGSSWMLNAYCSGRPLASIRAPSDGVMLFERGIWSIDSTVTGNLEHPNHPNFYPHPGGSTDPPVERPWDWSFHGRRRNILWCDGHVAAFWAAHWPEGNGSHDPDRIRHMRFGLPGNHPLDP